MQGRSNMLIYGLCEKSPLLSREEVAIRSLLTGEHLWIQLWPLRPVCGTSDVELILSASLVFSCSLSLVSSSSFFFSPYYLSPLAFSHWSMLYLISKSIFFLCSLPPAPQISVSSYIYIFSLFKTSNFSTSCFLQS